MELRTLFILEHPATCTYDATCGGGMSGSNLGLHRGVRRGGRGSSERDNTRTKTACTTNRK